MGNELFEKVVKLSGLPPLLIKKELKILLKKSGVMPNTLTKANLRRAMANYLRDIMNKMAKE